MSVFTVKAALVSGVIGLASVFAFGASVQAAPVASHAVLSHGSSQSAMQINHRPGHNQGPSYGHRPNQRPSYGHRPNQRPNHYRQACSPRDAVSKASRMGLRNTRISSSRSTIRVSGLRHGRPASVVFGKSRGCPVLR